MSVRIASWTAVRVRDRGRFWVWEVRERAERLGRGRMRREARIRTWRSENFFSSSRVRLFYCRNWVSGFKLWVFVDCLDKEMSFVFVLLDMRLNIGIPLLDLVEALEKRDWDKDDNSLLSVTDFDLYCSGHT